MFYNGTWGRVCANGISPATATAVCWQLDCGAGGVPVPAYAQEPAPAWLAWVGCEEGTRSLWRCPSAPWRLQDCGPGGDAHIMCDMDRDGRSEIPTPSPGSSARPGSPPASGRPGSPSSCHLAMSLQVPPAAPPWQHRQGPCCCSRCYAWSWGRCCAWHWAPWPCRCTVPGLGVEVGLSGWVPEQSWFGGPGAHSPWSSSEGGQRVTPVPPTVPMALSERCLSLQALTEMLMPSLMPSTKSWTTP